MTKEEKIYLRTLCPKCSEFIDIEYVDEELQALRAWKAKARPFLEEAEIKLRLAIERSSSYLNSEATSFMGDKLETLTELLGGSDEN